jgi:type IV secretion system protein VirB4
LALQQLSALTGMAKFQDMIKLGARDPRAGDRLPYDHHLNAHTIVTRAGDLMQMIQLEGFPFETADTEMLNHLHSARDVVLRGISSSQLVMYCHVLRRRVSAELALPQPAGLAQEIDTQWRARLAAKKLYVNDIVITLVRRPPVGKVGFFERLGNRLRRVASSADQQAAQGRAFRELDAARNNLLSAFGRYAPRLLGQYRSTSGPCSEPLEILSALYNGDMQPVLVPQTDLGQYLPYKRISFGLDTLELRGATPALSRLAAMVSVKEYPAHTTPGMFDALLRLPHELTLSESFAFLDRQITDERIGLALRRQRAASDETVTLRRGLLAAKDEVTSGTAAYGEHHLTIMVRAESLAALDTAVADVQSALADMGAIAVREDVNLEPAFWAQFPGNMDYIARKAMISTANLAGLFSMHNFPLGNAAGGPWGEPIAVLETTSSTPYFLNLHHGDLGNFTLIGPSGSGKTVVLNFLIAQTQKFAPRTFFFDKDRGAEIFIRTLGGHYDVLRPGTPTGFNPLALPDTPGNRAFLRRWLAQLLSAEKNPLTADELAVVAEAVDGNYAQRSDYRRLRYLVELLAGGSRPTRGDLASRLSPWHGSGEHAWLFDNEHDELDLDAATIGFDMTTLLDIRLLRTPAMMYLFHRAEERLDGHPALIVIDEGWKVLDDDVFLHQLKDWMKTIRKRNGIVGFATQSASDALDSRISSTIVEQAATQFFLCNPKAQAADYCDGFGLSAHEFDLIRSLPEHLRCVLVKQGNSSVVVRLDMQSMPDILTILSGRESSVRRLDALRLEHGDDPQSWLAPLLARTGTHA